jgi:FkbM family methyltransferase
MSKFRILLVSRVLWVSEYFYFYRRWKKVIVDSQIFSTSKQNIILDVGANIGQSIVFFSKIVPNSFFYAFEPHPDCFSKIEGKFSTNVQAFNLAISISDGVVPFYISPMSETSTLSLPNFDSKWFHLKNKILGITKENSYVEIKVRCRSIDSFLFEYGIQFIDLMKIDVEGSEFSVLQGSEYSIRARKINAIQLEVHHDDLRISTHNEIIHFLENYGFKKNSSVRHSFGNFTEELWILQGRD